MTAEFIRDAAATAAILGFFASSWFGWSLENPPVSWRRGLIIGSVLSLLTAAAGGLLVGQYWSDGSVFDATTARSFGIIVGIEIVLAGVGSWLLTARHRSELVPPWIALVVSVAALVSVPVARARSLTISAVTGLVTGSLLLVAALYSLVSVLMTS